MSSYWNYLSQLADERKIDAEEECTIDSDKHAKTIKETITILEPSHRSMRT